MGEEQNESLNFRLRQISKTRAYFTEEIKQNDLMSKIHEKVCTTLNYIEQSVSLVSAITGSAEIPAFASLICIPIGIAISAVGLKIYAITAKIKKKSKIKKKRSKYDKLVLLAKSQLNTTKVLMSKALIDSSISLDEFVLVNDMMKEYNNMKETIKNHKITRIDITKNPEQNINLYYMLKVYKQQWY